MNLIEARGLKCLLGHDPLFEDLDFDVEPGDVIQLKGQNGSGKTTFLRALIGAQRINAGSIKLEGKLLDHLSPCHRETMAPLVDQAPLLNWDVSAIDNLIDTVSVGSNLLKWFFTSRRTLRKRILKEYGELIQRFGLHTVIQRPARELSIGQRRLLTLVRALRRRPDGKPRVLLLDEPLAGLQHQRLQTVLDVLHDRVSEGWAIVVAEHMSEIERLTTRPALHFPFRKRTLAENQLGGVPNDESVMIHERLSKASNNGDARECLLKLATVSAGYGDDEVVHVADADPIELREGEITAIRGPNAIGKSTLFRALFNDESTKAWLHGDVYWRSRKINHVRDRKHVPPDAVAWIPQERFDFPGMTVEETLAGALVTGDFRGVKAAIKDLIGGLKQIEHEKRKTVLILVERLCQKRPDGKTILKSRWETLSGGERAIATLAMGLVNAPTVIFLDEPAANLDSHALTTLQVILRRFVEDRGASCFLIEHRASFLDGFADHVITIGGD